MAKTSAFDMKDTQLTQQQMMVMAQALKTAIDVTCECGCMVFNEGFKLKQLSKLITGESQNRILPIPVAYCVKCHKEYIPEEQREEKSAPSDNVIMMDFKNKK